jgi:hypothetical protein
VTYVVKATGRTGNVCWLTAANAKGIRTIGIREQADVFTTEIDARMAIAVTAGPFKMTGIVFSVESAEQRG